MVVIFLAGCREVDRVSEDWEAVAPRKLPEAGITQWTLYRTHGLSRERVDDLVARYRVYGNCIAYEKISSNDEYRVACGSSRPVVVLKGQGEWELDDVGLTQHGRLVTRDLQVFREERIVSTGALRAVARQGATHAGSAITIVLRPVESNEVLPGGETALVVAVLGRNAAAVRALIGRGADPNRPGEGNRYPIVLAAFTGDADITRMLLDSGARLDVTVSGVGPVTAAAGRNYLDVVRLLVKSGRATRTDITTARSHARNRPDILELLGGPSDETSDR